MLGTRGDALVNEAVRCVPTPGAVELLALLETGDSAALYSHVDQAWMELWYAFEPAELRKLLEQRPPPATIGTGVALLASLTGATLVATVASRTPASPDDATGRLLVVAHDAADLRLKGRPLEAMPLINEAVKDVRTLSGALVDASEGIATIHALQGGLTALLAGDLAAARALFLRGMSPFPPARFPFALRDMAAKMALTHAVAGDIGEARHWIENARAIARTDSWVETLVDDTVALVDYICAVDSLELEVAERIRRERPSPLADFELWGIALQAQVRHLVTTRRVDSAVQVCDGVAAAGMPQPGSDGWQATVLTEARLICRSVGDPEIAGAAAAEPWYAVARRKEHFLVGRFDEIVVPHPCEVLHPHRDVRPALALRLLRAQAMDETGLHDEARSLMLATLGTVFERGLLPLLRFTSRRGLELVADTDLGARAAALVAEHDVPQVEVIELLESSLTPAEISVLRLLVQRLTREEMAQQLFLSVNTVKSQLASAYRKMGVRTRAEAVMKAQRLGL